MRNILLPTDFSDNSRNAVHYAMKFFEGHECNFYFLNVQKISEFTTDDVYTTSPRKSVYEAIVGDNMDQLQNFVKEFEAIYSGRSYTFHSSIDYDVFVDAINQAVKINDIDLIIMGTNGATGAEKVLFGSNTLHVIRHVDCPVLAIPENFEFKQVTDILFSYHFQEPIKLTKIDPLLKLIELHEASIKVLEIDEKPSDSGSEDEPNSDLVDVFSIWDTEFFFQKGIPTPIAVNSFVQLIDVQMHATFIERRNFLKRFMFGSETSKISYETIVPLLVLHR